MTRFGHSRASLYLCTFLAGPISRDSLEPAVGRSGVLCLVLCAPPSGSPSARRARGSVQPKCAYGGALPHSEDLCLLCVPHELALFALRTRAERIPYRSNSRDSGALQPSLGTNHKRQTLTCHNVLIQFGRQWRAQRIVARHRRRERIAIAYVRAPWPPTVVLHGHTSARVTLLVELYTLEVRF